MCVWLKTAKSTDLCSKRLQNGESKIRKNSIGERNSKAVNNWIQKAQYPFFPHLLLFAFTLSPFSLSPIARIHLLVLIQSSLRLDKFKETSVIHSLGLSTCCAVSRASAKDIFGAVRTKSGFGGNYCTKDASNFHCISIILCIIIILIIIIFFHRCFLLSGSGSKLKSHFAFNWYSLTPQKRPNEFDVKTFDHPLSPYPCLYFLRKPHSPLPKTLMCKQLFCRDLPIICPPSAFPPPSRITGVTSTRWSKDNVNERMTRSMKKRDRERETGNEVASVEWSGENTFH